MQAFLNVGVCFRSQLWSFLLGGDGTDFASNYLSKSWEELRIKSRRCDLHRV